MIYSFFCLGHYTIVSCNYDNGNISNLCSTGTHSGKCLMTWSIEECYLTSVLKDHAVSADMLSYTSGFTCNHVCVPDIIKQLGFPMIDMAHDSNNWRSWFKILLFIIFLPYCFLYFCAHEFYFKTEFISK